MARRRGQRFALTSGRKGTTVDLLRWRHYTSSPFRFKRNLLAARLPGRALPRPVRPGAEGATNISGTGVGTWTQSWSNNHSTISELLRERLFGKLLMSFPRYTGCSKRSRCQAVRAGWGTHRRWVQAHSRYAATSARARQRRRWAVFSGLRRAVRRARLDG